MRRKRKGKIHRCKPGLPSCANVWDVTLEPAASHLQPSTEWELWIETQNNETVNCPGAEDGPPEDIPLSVREKTSTVWAGNLLPHEDSCFHFCPFCLEEKITNAVAYTRKNIFTERFRERTFVEAAAWSGAADCLAGGRGDGPWEVGRVFEESAVWLLSVHPLLPPLGIFSVIRLPLDFSNVKKCIHSTMIVKH